MRRLRIKRFTSDNKFSLKRFLYFMPIELGKYQAKRVSSSFDGEVFSFKEYEIRLNYDRERTYAGIEINGALVTVLRESESILAIRDKLAILTDAFNKIKMNRRLKFSVNSTNHTAIRVIADRIKKLDLSLDDEDIVSKLLELDRMNMVLTYHYLVENYGIDTKGKEALAIYLKLRCMSHQSSFSFIRRGLYPRFRLDTSVTHYNHLMRIMKVKQLKNYDFDFKVTYIQQREVDNSSRCASLVEKPRIPFNQLNEIGSSPVIVGISINILNKMVPLLLGAAIDLTTSELILRVTNSNSRNIVNSKLRDTNLKYRLTTNPIITNQNTLLIF